VLQFYHLRAGKRSSFSLSHACQDVNILLIMESCPQQLFVFKSILNTFADSIGLKVNYLKSSIYPINILNGRLSYLAATFHCQAGSMSFTYLGLPLSLKNPTIQECMSLVHRMERRLISTPKFLTQGGKLQMVNYVLSSLATFICAPSSFHSQFYTRLTSIGDI
jgi:hypothetical protein